MSNQSTELDMKPSIGLEVACVVYRDNKEIGHELFLPHTNIEAFEAVYAYKPFHLKQATWLHRQLNTTFDLSDPRFDLAVMRRDPNGQQDTQQRDLREWRRYGYDWTKNGRRRWLATPIGTIPPAFIADNYVPDFK